ncbi:battenin [Nematostella vectensis]|uniref:battenin n=1 Tax=Nematostella vectensis TaxID=45351 RepID=UPI002076FD66|nr:battenin [Nematostella vectensis]
MEKSPSNRDKMREMLEYSSSDDYFRESEDEWSPLHSSPEQKRKEKTQRKMQNMSKYGCSFFFLGATLTASLALTICAAEDILSGTVYATGWVLVAAAAPSCLMKITFLCSSCLTNLSLVTKTLGMFIFMITGLLFLAFSVTRLDIRLIGVCFISAATGLGEITLLVYAATKFQEVALSAYIAGTATGGVLSVLPYVGMTSWSSIKPRTAALVPVFWSLHLLIFAVMKTKKLTAELKGDSRIRQEIYQYESQEICVPFYQERLMQMWKSLHDFIMLFLVYFAVYFSLCGVLTTKVFSQAKDFGPREDFQHYVLSTILGEFLGRSFMSLLRSKTPGVNYKLPSVFGIIAVFLAVLFILSVWFSWISRIWVMFVVCFMQGVCSGIQASNSYHAIANRTHAEHAQFILTIAGLAESLGMMTAGLIGLHTEPAMREHCLESQYYANQNFCMTRIKDAKFWGLGREGQFR